MQTTTRYDFIDECKINKRVVINIITPDRANNFLFRVRRPIPKSTNRVFCEFKANLFLNQLMLIFNHKSEVMVILKPIVNHLRFAFSNRLQEQRFISQDFSKCMLE